MNSRSGTPACGTASPIPRCSIMMSVIRSTSRRMLSSIFSTGLAAPFSTAAG